MSTTTSAPPARRIRLSDASEDVLAAVAEACGPTGRAPIAAVAACCPTQSGDAITQRLRGLQTRGLVRVHDGAVNLTAAGRACCAHLYS